MKRSDMDAALEELYAQVPDVGCKGLCHQACGPIGMNPREAQRIAELGVKIPHYEDGLAELVKTGDYTCPALDGDNRCMVYERRPMLCRLWGAIEGLPCEFGCTPAEGELLPDAEGSALLAKSLDVGKPNQLSEEDLARLQRRMADPKFRQSVRDYVKNRQVAADPEQAVERWRGAAPQNGLAMPPQRKKLPRRRRG